MLIMKGLMLMDIRKLRLRINELYAATDEPISSLKDYAVLFALYLPLFPVLLLVTDSWWLYVAVVAAWSLAADIVFRLYRERKKKQHTDRYE